MVLQGIFSRTGFRGLAVVAATAGARGGHAQSCARGWHVLRDRPTDRVRRVTFPKGVYEQQSFSRLEPSSRVITGVCRLTLHARGHGQIALTTSFQLCLIVRRRASLCQALTLDSLVVGVYQGPLGVFELVLGSQLGLSLRALRVLALRDFLLRCSLLGGCT